MATLTMDVDDEEEMPSVSSNKLEKKRFEVKKVNTTDCASESL